MFFAFSSQIRFDCIYHWANGILLVIYLSLVGVCAIHDVGGFESRNLKVAIVGETVRSISIDNQAILNIVLL